MRIHPKVALLALIGVQDRLTAEQKHDIVSATLQTAPGGVASAGAMALEWHLSDVLTLVTLIFIVLQIAHLIWKWRRLMRIDAKRDAKNQELPEDSSLRGEP